MHDAAVGERAVEIVEVGPRDGLQNEREVFSTANKVALIARLVAAGVRRLEVASFVNPARVPQMADAEQVVAALEPRPGVTYIGLVLNVKGVERALATAVGEIGAVCLASDTFGQRNQGQTSAASVETAGAVVRAARAAGRRAQVTIATACGCPFEGRVPVARVVGIAARLADYEPCEIAIADTIGAGVPAQVEDLIDGIRAAVPGMPIRAHFHNTRNTGIANAWAAVRAGARALDASIGGLGGCPFAPRATGNIATEDLLYLLDHSGIATGVALGEVIDAGQWLARTLGRDLPSQVGKAGDFPAVDGATRGGTP